MPFPIDYAIASPLEMYAVNNYFFVTIICDSEQISSNECA